MFPGSFRAKLNSRFHRRACMFATAVVALHPSFLALYPLLAHTYSTRHLKNKEWNFLACVARRSLLSAFLQLDGALRHALS